MIDYFVFPLIIIMQVDVAQDLRGILIRIGRFKSLELHYSKVHLKSIKQLWEDFDSRQRTSKLSSERNEVERLSSSNEFQSSSPSISFSSWLPVSMTSCYFILSKNGSGTVHSSLEA